MKGYYIVPVKLFFHLTNNDNCFLALGQFFSTCYTAYKDIFITSEIFKI